MFNIDVPEKISNLVSNTKWSDTENLASETCLTSLILGGLGRLLLVAGNISKLSRFGLHFLQSNKEL